MAGVLGFQGKACPNRQLDNGVIPLLDENQIADDEGTLYNLLVLIRIDTDKHGDKMLLVRRFPQQHDLPQ